MSLYHKCLAVHIFHASPIPPKVRRTGRFLLELFGFAALMAVMFFALVIVGDA
jgi:hypothetical protein